MKWITLSLAISLFLVNPVNAKTDREIVQKKIGKYAVVDGAKPKAFCYCIDDNINLNGRVGHIQQFLVGDQVKVLCHSPTYNANGDDTGGFVNCFDFEPLAK